MSSTVLTEIQTRDDNVPITTKKLRRWDVIKDIYKYADASLDAPVFEDIAARLNAYLIVDALLIALLVTLLPMTKSQLLAGFSWTAEDVEYFSASSWAPLLIYFQDPQTVLDNATRCWVTSIALLVNSFCFALFTYVQLLGARKDRLHKWYSLFTYFVSISLYSLLGGLISFFLSCLFWVQNMNGARGLVLFLSAFVGILVPILFFIIIAPFITAFINSDTW